MTVTLLDKCNRSFNLCITVTVERNRCLLFVSSIQRGIQSDIHSTSGLMR